MTVPLSLHLGEVRSAMSWTLLAAEARPGSEVAVAVDHYGHLPVHAAFDMAQEPETLTVGQVSENLAHLRELDEPKPDTVWHDLAHLIGLLRALQRVALG